MAVFNGGNDDETFIGEIGGSDTLFGGGGRDSLIGLSGSNYIEGGLGADVLESNGSGELYGGEGWDYFYVGPEVSGANSNTVSGGTGYDVLDVRAYEADEDVTFTVTFAPGSTTDGEITVETADGTVSTITFTSIEQVIACFTPGTRIATPSGEVPVEDLRPGDRVVTRSHGVQVLRWTARRDLDGIEPHLRPVRVRAGALRAGVPARDLVVSPQHRLLVTGALAQLHFAQGEVLVAAKHLVGQPGIERLDVGRASYVHLLFDRHEVVLSEGAWTESFQPGDWTLQGLGAAQRDEILALFPDLATVHGREGYAAARPDVRAAEAAVLAG